MPRRPTQGRPAFYRLCRCHRGSVSVPETWLTSSSRFQEIVERHVIFLLLPSMVHWQFHEYSHSFPAVWQLCQRIFWRPRYYIKIALHASAVWHGAVIRDRSLSLRYLRTERKAAFVQRSETCVTIIGTAGLVALAITQLLRLRSQRDR